LDGHTEASALLPRNGSWEIFPIPRGSRLPFGQIFQAIRTLSHLKPRLLVTYNWGAMEWAAADMFLHIPHIHIEDGFGPDEIDTQLPRRVLFRRLVLNRQSTVVAPSRTLMQVATDVWQIAPERLVFIPNGVPCPRFVVPADLSLKAGFRGTGPVIGTIAALRKEKALDRLIAAFARIVARRPARLAIAGDGPERAHLERMALDHGLAAHVTFLGRVEKPERALSCFDLFALSSDTEQMPFSVLEAMSAGRAIVATKVGDVPAMVAPENCGFIVAPDAIALADGMLTLLDDPIRRRAIGEANRRRARAEFDEKRMTAAYERLFATTIDAERSRAPLAAEPFPSTQG
jgi:glycosyltransferase involved in cell wall biosynthesis